MKRSHRSGPSRPGSIRERLALCDTPRMTDERRPIPGPDLSATPSTWRVGDRVRSQISPTDPAGTVTEVREGLGSLAESQTVTFRRDDDETHVALGGELEPAG
jgi:hypothetical protein